jgi:hypothetical protein
MKDKIPRFTAKLYGGDLNEIHYTTPDINIKALEERVYELERHIDQIYRILESKQDAEASKMQKKAQLTEQHKQIILDARKCIMEHYKVINELELKVLEGLGIEEDSNAHCELVDIFHNQSVVAFEGMDRLLELVALYMEQDKQKD